MTNSRTTHRMGLISTFVGGALACGTLTTAFADTPAAVKLDQRVSFDIPAQALPGALMQFSAQTGLEFSASTDLVEGKRSAALKGTYATDEALQTLLEGTGLEFTATERGIVAIRAIGGGRTAQFEGNNDPNALRVAQAGTGQSAQEQPEATNSLADSQETKLEEVLVTATKREERLQDIPMSIAVIGSQDIERRGLVGMEDYLRSIPGVNQIDQGPTSNAIVIRGITTSPQFENFSSGTSVGMYFDETSITAAGGLGAGGIDVRPVDLARIEVLRGPQGTTFGSASLGGAVRLIPQRPVLNSFASAVSGSLSNTGEEGGANSMMQGMLNVPVIADRLALRAVAYRFEDSGAYRNVVGNDPTSIALVNNFNLGNFIDGYSADDVGRTVSTGGRLAAAWQIHDRIDATLVYLTQKIEQDGWPLATLDGYRQVRFPVAPQARLRGEAGEVDDTDIDLANAVVNLDLGPLALTTVLSRVDSGSQAAATDRSTATPPTQNNLRSSANGSTFRNTSGEVRLRSTYEGALQFLAGVFYEDIEEDFLQTSNWMGPPGTSPFPTEPILFFSQTRDLTQLAGFGEVSYTVADRLTFTAGARHFKYDKNETTLQEGGAVPIGLGVRSVFDTDDAETSWKAGLSYKVGGDGLLYANWSQGFRLGRATAGLPASCDADLDGTVDSNTNLTMASTRIVDSDFLDNYEIGAKFAFADRKLLIDGAVYRINWDGLPIRQIALCGLQTQSYTANVGSAVSEGAELQIRLLPLKGLQIDIGGAYNRAELAKDAPTLNASEGAPLPGAPDVNASLGIQYDFPAWGFDAFVRSDVLYAGRFHGDLLENPNTVAGEYVKLDLRAGVRVRNLRVEVFAKNVTNEDEFTWRGLSNSNASFGYRLRPRTIGVELGYSFQ